MRNAVFASLVMLAVAMSAPAQSARHPFTFEYGATMRHAEVVAVSPDGKTILYRVSFGGPKGPSNKEWRLIGASGGDARLLNIPENFTPAGFTGDGKALYGTFEVSKQQQLATLPLAPANTAAAAAATAAPLTGLPKGIRSALISPDGKRYALLADPRLPDPLAEVHTVIEAEPTSLYVINADGSGGAWWCPTLRDIAYDGLAWSPDGSSLAVMSQTPKIGFHDVKSFIDTCNASGTHHVATIDNAASNVGWIDGGKDLVFLSTTTSVITPDHVWTVPAAGGSPLDRTPTLSGSAIHLFVDPQGNPWVTVARGVELEIDAFQNNALSSTYTWPGGTIDDYVTPQLASAPAVRVFTVADPQHADNVAVANGNTLQKVTNEGDDQVAKIALGEVRAVRWTSPDGTALEGIVTFPADYVAGRHYPFIVFPHGGPEGNDTLSMSFFPRFFAGIGYIVLQPEYRGSTGYGSDFLNAIYQHFGDRAYHDVDSATDYAIAQGWADPKRLAMFGWSAGGFMTAWSVTQTNRYRAAIEGAGITDWASFIWTSDLQQIDYDARWPDKDPDAFLVFSAVMHSENVTTPLLILHGAADQRVPTYQGRELFEVLAARGKTTRMVTYPGSPHFPVAWEQVSDVFRETAAWLARYNP
ncbi:MAG: S9 family peptidase [Candidatus Korobacteraceae bacterium]